MRSEQEKLGLQGDVDRDEASLFDEKLQMPLIRRASVILSHQASRISWHSHEFVEILFVSEGVTAYEFENREVVEIAGDHFLVIPPGVEHRAVFDFRHPARLCGLMLNLDSPQAGERTPFSEQDLEWVKKRLLGSKLEARRMSTELCRAITLLSRILLKYGKANLQPAILSSLRLVLSSVVLESAKLMSRGAVEEISQTIEHAMQFMQQRFREPISMDDVAHAVGSSRSRLFVMFKRATGMTPNHFLLKTRIDQAQQELTQTLASVTQIALNCGFSSGQYFSMVFRKYTGFKPLEYRRKQLPKRI